VDLVFEHNSRAAAQWLHESRVLRTMCFWWACDSETKWNLHYWFLMFCQNLQKNTFSHASLLSFFKKVPSGVFPVNKEIHYIQRYSPHTSRVSPRSDEHVGWSFLLDYLCLLHIVFMLRSFAHDSIFDWTLYSSYLCILYIYPCTSRTLHVFLHYCFTATVYSHSALYLLS